EEIRRRAIVDRDDDDAAKQAAQNATIHSGRFSLQKTILSPLRRPRACNSAAKARAARVTSAYEWLRLRNPSSWTRNSPRARERSPKKSISVSRATSEL